MRAVTVRSVTLVISPLAQGSREPHAGPHGAVSAVAGRVAADDGADRAARQKRQLCGAQPTGSARRPAGVCAGCRRADGAPRRAAPPIAAPARTHTPSAVPSSRPLSRPCPDRRAFLRVWMACVWPGRAGGQVRSGVRAVWPVPDTSQGDLRPASIRGHGLPARRQRWPRPLVALCRALAGRLAQYRRGAPGFDADCRRGHFWAANIRLRAGLDAGRHAPAGADSSPSIRSALPTPSAPTRVPTH